MQPGTPPKKAAESSATAYLPLSVQRLQKILNLKLKKPNTTLKISCNHELKKESTEQ